jgi:flagellar basal body-associated protein FliL
VAEKAEDKSKESPGATDASGEAAPSKKKKLIIIGGAVGVIAIVAAAAVMMMGGGGEEPAQDPAAGSEVAKAEAGKEPNEAGAEKAPAAGEKNPEGSKAEGGKAKDGAATSGTGASSDSSGEFGETYEFKAFHLNLGNPLENHYVRLSVAVEFKGGPDQKAEIEKRLPQLRDAVVGVVSRKSREFLLGPDGKAQLRREILIRLNRYMSKPLEAVYITDFIIE